MLNRLQNLPFHPFLFALYPILFFYSHNQSQLKPNIILIPSLISLFATAIVFFTTRHFLKSPSKAAVATTSLSIAFFSYGHTSHALNQYLFISLPGLVIGPDKILFPLTLLLLFLVFRSLHRQSHLHPKLNPAINFTAIFLVSIQLFSITQTESRLVSTPSTTPTNTPFDASKSPDIYHIILDGYARNNTLQDIYHYDNSAFTQQLKDLGFRVADQATSNYAHTFLSLSSSFNLQYLDHYPQLLGQASTDFGVPTEDIQNNLAMQTLRDFGYTTINFDSGWGPTMQMPVADYNLTSTKSTQVFGQTLAINEFYLVFLQTTALTPFIQDVLADHVRAGMLYAFDQLTEIPYRRGTHYTLAHITLPHPPYLFDENGDPIPDQVLELAGEAFQDRGNYVRQLRFTSDRALDTIQKILTRSQTPPIIILQSDHGPASILGHPKKWTSPPDPAGVKERMSILYAVYGPDNLTNSIPPDITPINTFPILFNTQFNQNYDLFENKNYFSDYNQTYLFTEVTDLLQNQD